MVHENVQVQESFCDHLGFDIVYSENDSVARVNLNKIPQKFINLLRKQGKSLKVILDQINKISCPAKQYYWVFPQILASTKVGSTGAVPSVNQEDDIGQNSLLSSILEDFPDPADFMIGFFAVKPKSLPNRVSSKQNIVKSTTTKNQNSKSSCLYDTLPGNISNSMTLITAPTKSINLNYLTTLLSSQNSKKTKGLRNNSSTIQASERRLVTEGNQNLNSTKASGDLPSKNVLAIYQAMVAQMKISSNNKNGNGASSGRLDSTRALQTTKKTKQQINRMTSTSKTRKSKSRHQRHSSVGSLQ